jgi:type I restriction enzyme S subunit
MHSAIPAHREIPDGKLEPRLPRSGLDDRDPRAESDASVPRLDIARPAWRLAKNVRTSGEYPYYGASGIVDYVGDSIFEDDNLLVSEDGANLLARSTPIAFSVSGKYWFNNHAHILHFENMTTQRFAEYYLESIKLDDYITGAAQPKLNQKALNSIPIPIPKPVDEQAKIVESVESLQEETQRLGTLYSRKLAAREALKKSLLHQAFTGEL